ncbi:DUF1266 domain-containing protein [Streptomyces sp. VRA16 Mangrove soil]|uniref:DUF1266 domain-containing protein n=1 Tax=Streptomyces sp. VRA16 Mangrove soil TaxID=2817434 RepID=UPI001A9D716A|nr:DUF1266 domain-containing protein [Streptomyces sp. VRA16 Mangrove soil]MBO1332206.1 DUF1266 domain-containing protein [Streptomyces sp. VRA16 Mangrove soil]
MLPRHDDLVLCRIPFPIEETEADDGSYAGVYVNPGSPCSVHVPFDAARFRAWRALMHRAERRGHDDDELVTMFTGPQAGPLAHGLACGTHLAVHNRVPWNEVGPVYHDYEQDVEVLRESWDVTDRRGWLEQLTYLLRGENSPRHPELALRVRRALPGGRVDPERWRELAVAEVRRISDDARDAAAVRDVVGRILRYESRFRADGLLAADGPGSVVVSALAYDYGRAVNFARWGLGARFAGQRETEDAVVRAGELAREVYGSWAEFSAGYVLGRVLRFDDESFGHMYGSAVRPHEILTTHPESPWRSMPFRT